MLSCGSAFRPLEIDLREARARAAGRRTPHRSPPPHPPRPPRCPRTVLSVVSEAANAYTSRVDASLSEGTPSVAPSTVRVDVRVETSVVRPPGIPRRHDHGRGRRWRRRRTGPAYALLPTHTTPRRPARRPVAARARRQAGRAGGAAGARAAGDVGALAADARQARDARRAAAVAALVGGRAAGAPGARGPGRAAHAVAERRRAALPRGPDAAPRAAKLRLPVDAAARVFGGAAWPRLVVQAHVGDRAAALRGGAPGRGAASVTGGHARGGTARSVARQVTRGAISAAPRGRGGRDRRGARHALRRDAHGAGGTADPPARRLPRDRAQARHGRDRGGRVRGRGVGEHAALPPAAARGALVARGAREQPLPWDVAQPRGGHTLPLKALVRARLTAHGALARRVAAGHAAKPVAAALGARAARVGGAARDAAAAACGRRWGLLLLRGVRQPGLGGGGLRLPEGEEDEDEGEGEGERGGTGARVHRRSPHRAPARALPPLNPLSLSPRARLTPRIRGFGGHRDPSFRPRAPSVGRLAGGAGWCWSLSRERAEEEEEARGSVLCLSLSLRPPKAQSRERPAFRWPRWRLRSMFHGAPRRWKAPGQKWPKKAEADGSKEGGGGASPNGSDYAGASSALCVCAVWEGSKSGRGEVTRPIGVYKLWRREKERARLPFSRRSRTRRRGRRRARCRQYHHHQRKHSQQNPACRTSAP